MTTITVKFTVGQLVHHKKFDYRGVVIDVDPRYQGTEDWYEQVAKSRPPRDKPWYHVLVHEAGINTYVAERHLEPDGSDAPINHPALGDYFSDFRGGTYVPRAIN